MILNAGRVNQTLLANYGTHKAEKWAGRRSCSEYLGLLCYFIVIIFIVAHIGTTFT